MSCASPSWPLWWGGSRCPPWGSSLAPPPGLHPSHPRRADTERPDEWRIDLDPMPRCGFGTVRRVAHVVREILGELDVTGWPKTSGGNGLRVYVRIEPRWGFAEVCRAAYAFARE